MSAEGLHVALRISADGSVAVREVKQVKAELDGIGSSAETAGTRTEAGMTKARRGVESISQQLKQARDVLISFAGVTSLVGLARKVGSIADEMSRMRGQIALVTGSTAELAAVQERLFEVSQRTSTGLASAVQRYTRLARSTADLGIEQDRLAALTETINQSFVVSATPASAAANAITQLTQAFAGGVLRAEEFNSVIENSPRLAQALADGLGVGIGALRRMVNEGQITSEAIIRALQSQAETIRRAFEWLREDLATAADHLDAILDAALVRGSVLLALCGARAGDANGLLGRKRTPDHSGESCRRAHAAMGAAAAATGARVRGRGDPGHATAGLRGGPP